MRTAPYHAVTHGKSATAPENRALLAKLRSVKTRAARARARHELVLRNQGLVRKIALKFRDRTRLPFDDLISEGQVALLDAIDGYTVGSPAQFTTYAGRAIFRAIQRFITCHERAIVLTESAFRDTASPETREAARRAQKLLSLDTPMGTGTTASLNPRVTCLADTVAQPQPDAAENPIDAAARQKRARTRVLRLLDGLSHRQRVAIEHTFAIQPPRGHMDTAAAVAMFDLTGKNLVKNKSVAMLRLRRAVRRELR